MSIIYNDKNLFDELIKLGQNPNFYAQQNTNFANMYKLLDNLEKQITPKPPGGEIEISHEGDPGTSVPLRSESLKNLGTLVNFLSAAKITIDGKRISYTPQEDPKDEAYQFYKLEPGGPVENDNRQQLVQGVFINKELLSAYLVSLQAQQQKNPNQVLSVMLSALIRETNNLLDTNINEKYQAQTQPGQPNQPGQSEQQGQQGQQGQSGQNTYTEQQGQSGQQNNKETIDAISLSELQPFNSDYISFSSLQRFLDKFPLLTNKEEDHAAAVSISQEINQAKGMMTRPSDTISLDNMNLTTFGLLTNQQLPLAYVLYGIIDNVSNIYRRFSIQFKDALDSSSYRRVLQQIQSDGPAASNMRTLAQLISNIRNEIGKKK